MLSLEIRLGSLVDVSYQLPVHWWWMKPLAMAPMLFTKSHNICKQCHVRRRMVLYGSIQPKRKDKRTSAQSHKGAWNIFKCVHWSRGPARTYRLSYANEPQTQHLFPHMTCCRKRIKYILAHAMSEFLSISSRIAGLPLQLPSSHVATTSSSNLLLNGPRDCFSKERTKGMRLYLSAGSEARWSNLLWPALYVLVFYIYPWKAAQRGGNLFFSLLEGNIYSRHWYADKHMAW